MRTHYYALRSDRLWWARIWVTSDGLITIASDYGYFGYWFGGPGCEIRKFLVWVDPSQLGYMANKLADGRRVYDADETARRVREEIIRMRKKKEIGRADARELWRLVVEYDLDNNDPQAEGWMHDELVREHFGDCPHHYFASTLPGDVRGFMRDVWPAFVEELKSELRAESAARVAFGEVLEMGV